MIWPIKYKLWRSLHVIVNRLAWLFADTSRRVPQPLRAKRRIGFWWRLNNWTADHYVDWWVKNLILKSKQENAQDAITTRRIK